MTEYEENNRTTHLSVITYSILFANDVACGALVQAVDDVKKSSLYKHEMKRMINSIEKSRQSYERRLKHVVGDKGEYYMDACEIFTNKVEHDIQVFFYTILNEYTKNGVTNAKIVARLQWARALVQAASQLWHDRTKEVSDYNLLPPYNAVSVERIRDYLSYLDITPIRKQLGCLIDKFFDESNNIECANGQMAYNIINRKLYDIHTVLSAAIHRDD